MVSDPYSGFTQEKNRFKRTHITPKGTIVVAEIKFRRGRNTTPRAVSTSLQICYTLQDTLQEKCSMKTVLNMVYIGDIVSRWVVVMDLLN